MTIKIATYSKKADDKELTRPYEKDHSDPGGITAPEEADPDSPPGPWDVEEWTGYEDEKYKRGPSARRDEPSHEAKMMTLKSRLNKALGKDYAAQLSKDDLMDILDEFGVPEVGTGDYMEDTSGGSKLMKFIEDRIGDHEAENYEKVYDILRSDGKCLWCRDDTGSEYGYEGDDISSPPLCQSCSGKDPDKMPDRLRRYMEKNLGGMDSMEKYKGLYETPTDPSEIEEKVPDYSGKHYEEDDDYAMAAKRLVQISNGLDKCGEYKMSSEIDEIIRNLIQYR